MNLALNKQSPRRVARSLTVRDHMVRDNDRRPLNGRVLLFPRMSECGNLLEVIAGLHNASVEKIRVQMHGSASSSHFAQAR